MKETLSFANLALIALVVIFSIVLTDGAMKIMGTHRALRAQLNTDGGGGGGASYVQRNRGGSNQAPYYYASQNQNPVSYPVQTQSTNVSPGGPSGDGFGT